ncbi:MAG: EutN/CcmL family microcompartment protein [Pseudomonadota bacterium]
MFVGRVVGAVWSTVKWPQIQGLKLLAVQPLHVSDLGPEGSRPQAACDELVICADVLDAGEGDQVVVAFGHAARVALQQVMGPEEITRFAVDAAVVAVVDGMQVDPEALVDHPEAT